MQILSTATGYEPEKLTSFLRSFRENTTTSHLTIFVDKANYEGYRKFESARIRIISVDQRIFKKQRIFDIMGDYLSRLVGLRASDDPRFYPACCARYFYYLDFIKGLDKGDPMNESILITDSRDVIFQSDPKGAASGDEIVFALEDKQIKNEPANYGWIERIYGKKSADDLGGEIVSCAGTTYGGMIPMLSYLEDMVSQLVQNRKVITLRPALDQGVHNYVLYHIKQKHASFSGPVDGQLATVGIMNALDQSFGNGRISFYGGSVTPAMVHQWDRHPELAEFIARTYA